MRKEAIGAIIIGIILGLSITYGFYTFRSRNNPLNNPELTSGPTISQDQPTPTPDQAANLLITSPTSESVVTQEEITISGTAKEDELIVIFVNQEEFITQADKIGAFAQKVTLDKGGNQIEVIAVDSEGQQRSEMIEVIFYDQSLTVEAASNQTATNSSEKTSTASAKPTTKATTSPKPTATKEAQ